MSRPEKGPGRSPKAHPEVLRLTAPLSPWGGLDTRTGTIIDERHPQFGESISGRVLCIPGSAGSTSGPSAIADCLRRGNGPAAVVLSEADAVLITGLWAAELLYESRCPIVILPEDEWPENRQRWALDESE